MECRPAQKHFGWKDIAVAERYFHTCAKTSPYMTSLQRGADNEQQLELEARCGQIGREKALAKGWEKGAKGCLINRLASSYLQQRPALHKKGLRRPLGSTVQSGG